MSMTAKELAERYQALREAAAEQAEIAAAAEALKEKTFDEYVKAIYSPLAPPC